MTAVGTGGVVITLWKKSKRFHKEYCNLTIELKDLTDQKLQDLVKDPRPSGLRFEKLNGHQNPDIYTNTSPETIKYQWRLMEPRPS